MWLGGDVWILCIIIIFASSPMLPRQVKQVYKVGQNCQGFGRQLNGLFKQAITAGKRVRAETSIASGAVSVSSAAAELAQLKLPTHNFEDAKVCFCVCVWWR